MAPSGLTTYLNDHLAGATLGVGLARLIEARTANTPLGNTMGVLASQIEEDRATLLTIMRRLDVAQNRLKRATGWVGEKASQAKFRGLTAGSQESATLMAVESLVLGVRGKLGLWRALQTVMSSHPELAEFHLDELAERARAQHEALERARLEIARHALV